MFRWLAVVALVAAFGGMWAVVVNED